MKTAKIQSTDAFEMYVKVQNANVCGVMKSFEQDFLN